MGVKGPPKPIRFTVLPQEAGLRLDQIMSQRPFGLSRSASRRLIDLGGVHVAGRRVRRCSQAVAAGQGVEIFFDDGPQELFRLTEEHLLFRDKYLIAIAKPAGIETQPTPARYKGTLYEAALTSLQDPYRPLDRPELGMVQRLDRETSGVLVFSTHPRSHGPLTRAFAERRVQKSYLALVQGSLQSAEGEIRSQLARSRGTNKVHSVEKGGKEAITRYRVLESYGEASLVGVEILTGRSHQIRAHMAEIGHPLLGDYSYGGLAVCLGQPALRQMLHSAYLDFPHPISGVQLHLEAPLPEDFTALLSTLRGAI